MHDHFLASKAATATTVDIAKSLKNEAKEQNRKQRTIVERVDKTSHNEWPPINASSSSSTSHPSSYANKHLQDTTREQNALNFKSETVKRETTKVISAAATTQSTSSASFLSKATEGKDILLEMNLIVGKSLQN